MMSLPDYFRKNSLVQKIPANMELTRLAFAIKLVSDLKSSRVYNERESYCGPIFFLMFYLFFFCVCRFVGRLFVKALGKPIDILSKLMEMAEFPANEEIELYEVWFMCNGANGFLQLFNSVFWV